MRSSHLQQQKFKKSNRLINVNTSLFTSTIVEIQKVKQTYQLDFHNEENLQQQKFKKSNRLCLLLLVRCHLQQQKFKKSNRLTTNISRSNNLQQQKFKKSNRQSRRIFQLYESTIVEIQKVKQTTRIQQQRIFNLQQQKFKKSNRLQLWQLNRLISTIVEIQKVKQTSDKDASDWIIYNSRNSKSQIDTSCE